MSVKRESTSVISEVLPKPAAERVVPFLRDRNPNGALDGDDIMQTLEEELAHAESTRAAPTHRMMIGLGIKEMSTDAAEIIREENRCSVQMLSKAAGMMNERLEQLVEQYRNANTPENRAKLERVARGQGHEEHLGPEQTEVLVETVKAGIDFSATYRETFPGGARVTPGQMIKLLSYFTDDASPFDKCQGLPIAAKSKGKSIE